LYLCYLGRGTILNVDFIRVYKDNIKQIEKEQNEAISNKNWTKLAKLEAKKAELEHKIEQN